MHLSHLSLTNFRNFTRLDVDIPGGTVLIVGDNAQGKTSLLEAIYYLATLDSFHATQDRQLISFLVARQPLVVARIVADFMSARQPHRLEVRIIQESNGSNGSVHVRKEALLDSVKLKPGDAVGQLKAVLFLPQMMRVIESSPEDRRRYLNLVLSQVVSYYPAALTDYARALSQRNALLKQLSEREGDLSQLDYWDDLLASTGAQLIFARIKAVQELDRLAARNHRELTQNNELLRLNYLPAFDPLPPAPGQFMLPLDAPVDRTGIALEQIQQGFRERLRQLRTEEILRGVTTVGPHRDELRFLSNGIDLGNYGSRGQVRTAMLALKLAEVAWIRERTDHWPVLLLDEVLAELDLHRRADLLSRLAESEQALLTTTDVDLFAHDFIQNLLYGMSGAAGLKWLQLNKGGKLMGMDDQKSGYIFQVNVSNGGVPKQAVRQALLTTLGLIGDRQRNTEVHGGPERAICLYSLERIQALQAEGHPIYPGSAGENLTLAGIDWDQMKPGARLQVGKEVELELTRYTTPCNNLTESFIDGYFNRIHPEKRPGWSRLYAKVIHTGEIRVGDQVTIL